MPVPDTDGWHPDATKAEYLAVPRASSSKLKQLRKTPAHLYSYLNQPQDETKTHFTVGDAAHVAVLQRDLWPKYKRLPEGDGRTTEVKEARAALVEEHGEEFCVPAEDYDTCSVWRERVWTHRLLRPLLEGGGAREVTGLVTDHFTQVPFKIRVDFLPRSRPVEIDFKTTAKSLSSLYVLAKEAALFGYDLQGALYLRGIRQLPPVGEHEDRTERWIVWLSKKKPYLIRVCRVRPEHIALCQQQINVLLPEYEHLLKTGDWHGYPEELEDLPIPDYHYGDDDG